MGLLMLVGFAGAVIVLGFLSCLAGRASERNHIRKARSEFEDWRWCTRR
jgi:hypothetical protein